MLWAAIREGLMGGVMYGDLRKMEIIIWISTLTGWHEGSDLDGHCADGDALSWDNSADGSGFVTRVRRRTGKCHESLQSRRQAAFQWVGTLGGDAVRYTDGALVRTKVSDLKRLNESFRRLKQGNVD